MTRMTRTASSLIAGFMMCLAGAAGAQDLSIDAVNKAGLSGKGGEGASPVVIKAQVLLDWSRFSPGVIDGFMGDNVRNALEAYERAHGLEADGELDETVLAKLSEAHDQPILKEYTITAEDAKGPFTKEIPDDFEKMAKLDRLGYTSLEEKLAEQFHMDIDLLKTLNRGAEFKEGAKIVVANVPVAKDDGRKGDRAVKRVEVDKKQSAVIAYGEEDKIVAFYPATIGSDDTPSPSGTWEVRAIAMDPTYTYDPDRVKLKGVDTKKKLTIPAGPNNPVGTAWIDLTKDTYGIHGTPEPSKVGKTASHGCVRLTNWDVTELASLVSKGVKVEFKGG